MIKLDDFFSRHLQNGSVWRVASSRCHPLLTHEQHFTYVYFHFESRLFVCTYLERKLSRSRSRHDATNERCCSFGARPPCSSSAERAVLAMQGARPMHPINMRGKSHWSFRALDTNWQRRLGVPGNRDTLSWPVVRTEDADLARSVLARDPCAITSTKSTSFHENFAAPRGEEPGSRNMSAPPSTPRFGPMP